MRSDLIYIPDSELDALIQQDTPYLDLTTLGLDIGDEPGSLSFYTREPCVLCCTEEVSRILSKLGLSTAIVEERSWGGTCLNRGCVPTKTLLHSADIYHDAKNGAPFGVSADNVTFDYAKIIERKNAVSKQLSNGVAFLEKSHGVTVFADHATLTDRQTVHLAGDAAAGPGRHHGAGKRPCHRRGRRRL